MLDAFRLEAHGLSQAVAGLSEDEWDLPTRCAPWSVRELVGHIRVVIAWLPGMLSAPQPEAAEVSAAEYYRPDNRFAPQTNAARIGLAQQHAAGQVSGPALAADFAETWQRVDRLCHAEPPVRVVLTRHGDAMLLSEFLVTRVVEIAVHGLDVADALGREPWLTPQAGEFVLELLLGPGHRELPGGADTNEHMAPLPPQDVVRLALGELGWDRPRLLRKATGREPLDIAEAARVERLGIRWLTLG